MRASGGAAANTYIVKSTRKHERRCMHTRTHLRALSSCFDGPAKVVDEGEPAHVPVGLPRFAWEEWHDECVPGEHKPATFVEVSAVDLRNTLEHRPFAMLANKRALRPAVGLLAIGLVATLAVLAFVSDGASASRSRCPRTRGAERR